MIQGHDQFTDTHLKINTKCIFMGSICKALYVVKAEEEEPLSTRADCAIPPAGNSVEKWPAPIDGGDASKVRHSKTSPEGKTAARPQQSRCSTQPEVLMRFQCRAFHRLTNAGKQGIVLVSGIFFASDHHGGIGVLNAIQNGRSLILGISRPLPILDQFCAGWIGFTLVQF